MKKLLVKDNKFSKILICIFFVSSFDVFKAYYCAYFKGIFGHIIVHIPALFSALKSKR